MKKLIFFSLKAGLRIFDLTKSNITKMQYNGGTDGNGGKFTIDLKTLEGKTYSYTDIVRMEFV